MTEDSTGPKNAIAIGGASWRDMRWGWGAAVRADASLPVLARLVADVLAMDFANAKTGRCDPGFRTVAARVGKSPQSIKRAIDELEDRGWIAVDRSAYVSKKASIRFLFQGSISRLEDHPNFEEKGIKTDTQKPIKTDTHSEGERVSVLTRKGIKTDNSYYIDKPKKNQRAPRFARLAESDQIADIAAELVRAIRCGNPEQLATAKPEFIDHIVAAGLLTDEELARCGVVFCDEGGGV